MSGSVHATIVALRHVEDEVSLARTKPSKQALDTIAQVLANVMHAREHLNLAAGDDASPLRRRQLARAVDHIDGALTAAHAALEPGREEHLQARLNEIVEHLVIAMTCVDE